MTKHFGYWIFGKDMNKVNLGTLKKIGVTDVFLNYYAINTFGEAKVISWIEKAKQNNINVHIWMQCFYNGDWINPAITNLDSKLKEAKKYANMKGVKGVHLDYLRYPGNAYKTSGGAQAITNFVKKVRSQNPNTFLSCAVMPEESDKYYYGQDIDALGKIVDCIIPMQYKGNYEAGNSWLASTTKYFTNRATVWSGLQAYKSDDNTALLSVNDLSNDIKTCLNNKAKGVILFRYGLSHAVNFKQFQPKSDIMTTISSNDIKEMARIVKTYIEKNKKIPSVTTVNKKKYSVGQVEYILSYAVNNPGKAVKVFTVKNAPNPTGDSVSEKLTESDYKDVAKRTTSYITTKKVCPNYSRTTKSKKRLRLDVVIYMLARVVNYYYQNKKMPKTALVSSNFFVTKKQTTTKTTTTKKKLYSYLTEYGCSGMGQCTGYFCGPSSLQQCFYRLTGIRVSEWDIADVAGTTTSGTDHEGLNTAVAWFNRKYNKNIKVTWKNFSDLGNNDSQRWNTLQQYINKGALFCHLLYRDQWGHYEVPRTVRDDDLVIHNSLGDQCGEGTYCGYIEERSKSAQKSYIQGISQKSIAILTI